MSLWLRLGPLDTGIGSLLLLLQPEVNQGEQLVIKLFYLRLLFNKPLVSCFNYNVWRESKCWTKLVKIDISLMPKNF